MHLIQRKGRGAASPDPYPPRSTTVVTTLFPGSLLFPPRDRKRRDPENEIVVNIFISFIAVFAA